MSPALQAVPPTELLPQHQAVTKVKRLEGTEASQLELGGFLQGTEHTGLTGGAALVLQPAPLSSVGHSYAVLRATVVVRLVLVPELLLQDQGLVGVGVYELPLHLPVIPPSEPAAVPVQLLQVLPGARQG